MRTLVFSGRSRRAELAAFVSCAVVLDFILNLVFRLALDDNAEGWARLGADTVLFLPLFALLARRLHDLGRSSWWSLFAVIVMGRTACLKALALADLSGTRDWIESTFEPVNWILVPGFLIVVIAAAFVPGTKGANRFGDAAQKQTAGAGLSAPAA
ncbi:MAG TPA: DUF805 domain-containing protein [Novosphingobium sp.]|nr:DUF805 domain-containing protein [Novosphingobium sp.]